LAAGEGCGIRDCAERASRSGERDLRRPAISRPCAAAALGCPSRRRRGGTSHRYRRLPCGLQCPSCRLPWCLPEPVGPVTSTNPFDIWTTSPSTAGRPSSSKLGMSLAMCRKTAEMPRRSRKRLARKRPRPGSSMAKSVSLVLFPAYNRWLRLGETWSEGRRRPSCATNLPWRGIFPAGAAPRI